jgi:hypothetical protein
MAIQMIHSFLVHPDKGVQEQTPIKGTRVTGEGELVQMLRAIYNAAPEECKYEISFLPKDGMQQNPCRDLFLAYIREPNKRNGQAIAARLQQFTTHRSGLGLLFLIQGREKADNRFVVSRFPADNGILAEENQETLSVKFIERIFMKSATAYKSAVYEGGSFDADFWIGKAIDKQINSDITISDYWIRSFLASDFAVTGARGTRRLAAALRDAMNQTDDLEVKQELAAAARLAPNLEGHVTSAAQFADEFHLSPLARDAFREPLRQGRLFNEQFQFTSAEFLAHLSFRSVELDNGAVLTASTAHFDHVFNREAMPDNQAIRFTTSGRIVNDKLRKAKP